ncbi:MAG: sulfotransferase domain-containing protein [Opitutales bacterium]
MTKLPDFLCIGAQKSGTTWLHNMLKQHPQIFLPKTKELMFFDVKRNFESEGLDGYSRNFAEAAPGQLIGEITPGYLWTATQRNVRSKNENALFRRRTPERVAETLGMGTKLLIILRDPVDRAISAFFHHFRKGRFTEIDYQLLKKDPNGIVDMGRYVRHINRWAKHFPKENFYITTYDELFTDPSSGLNHVYKFLGLQEHSKHKRIRSKYNNPSDYELREDGYWLVSCNGLTDIPTDRPVIPNEVIDFLKESYQLDNHRLAKRWKVDVSGWAA